LAETGRNLFLPDGLNHLRQKPANPASW